MDEPKRDLEIKVFANEDRAQFELIVSENGEDSGNIAITLDRPMIDLFTTAFNLLYQIGWTSQDVAKVVNFQVDYNSIVEARKKRHTGASHE